MQKKLQAGHEDAELEKKNLYMMKGEAEEWSRMAVEVLEQLGLEQQRPLELPDEDTTLSDATSTVTEPVPPPSKLLKQKVRCCKNVNFFSVKVCHTVFHTRC